MANNLTPLSIKTLFEEEKIRYEIPIYQRDYAWTEPQIRQLILDIADYAKDKSNCNYYIGTLIVYERKDDYETIYETIDGQQRLTTLSIILNLLYNKNKELDWFHNELGWFRGNILSFASRPRSTESLKHLSNLDKQSYDNPNMNIIQGYRDAEKALSQILKEKNLKEKDFVKYLANQVYILRVPVPRDTDLNHYFEIMNSRGEQLEKHEVLKAQCLKCLDVKDRVAFNKIWEAAANMERYIQYGFSKNERNAIFGGNEKDGNLWDVLDNNPEHVYENLHNSNEESESEESLEAIAKNDANISVKEEDNEDTNVRFNTVINFSNFLLHVLRIQTKTDIPLDDKRLLDLFKPYVKSDNSEMNRQFVKEFGYNLLKMKFLYDKYIIKREFVGGSDRWSLKRVRIYEGKKRSYSYVGTFSDTSNPDIESEENREIIMLLSMFHVSTPTLVYKHWLNGALKWCFEQSEPITAKAYKEYLEKMAEAFLRDRFLSKSPLDYFEIIYKNSCNVQNIDNNQLYIDALNAGTAVENFIFNYLDYLLWQNFRTTKSAFDVIGDNEKLRNDSRIASFEFTFRSSVEHYYPQNPIEGNDYKISKENLDCFGNLCLISNSKNSRLSNYMPLAKKEHYEQSENLDSIKQRIMMAYTEWDEGKLLMDKNGVNEIQDHYKKMKNVLRVDNNS